MLRRSRFSLKYLSTPLALTPLPPPSTRAVAKQGLGTPLVTARPAHGGESLKPAQLTNIDYSPHACLNPPTDTTLPFSTYF